MRKLFFTIFIFFTIIDCFGDLLENDSLYLITKYTDDSSKKAILKQLTEKYIYSEPAKGLLISKEYYSLAVETNDSAEIAQSNFWLGMAYEMLGDYSQALNYNFEALRMFKSQNDTLKNQTRRLLLPY